MRGYLVNWSVRARVISWVDSLQLTTWKFLLTLHLFSAAFFVSGRAVSMERFWIKCPTWEIFQMGITQFYWMISSAECVCISLSQRNRSIEHGLLRLLPGDFPDSHPIPDDLVHNWATSGHWVAHHESTLLESVPKQLDLWPSLKMSWLGGLGPNIKGSAKAVDF